ncbi:hypothetical protein ACG04R_16530 [Roseateles sp. BYS78W]|uniref:Uncharacterized protein n=1 Tax=Pelomonas candidula TaxID=3299025 RepID=A0ABW7HEF3_9BURK
MSMRPIYTIGDVKGVLAAAGVTDKSWSHPGSPTSFAVWLWTRHQCLSPEQVPDELGRYLSETHHAASAAV